MGNNHMRTLFGHDHMHVDFTTRHRLPSTPPDYHPQPQHHAPSLDNRLNKPAGHDARADSASMQRFRGADPARIGGWECEERHEKNRATAGECQFYTPANQ